MRTSKRPTRIAGALAIGAAAAMMLVSCAAPAADEEQADGPVILRYWSWAPNIAKIVDVWNAQNPDIQIEVNTSTGSNDIVAKLSAAKEAGTLPDLSNTSYENLPNLVVNGIAADITDAMADYEDQIAPAAWDLTTFDGVNYAVPQGTGPMFLYYRTDLFEAAGVEVPTTWDEYAEAARTIHAADPGKYLSTFPANDAQLFGALSQQAGSQWWSSEDGEWTVDIDGEASTKVAEYWNGLVDEGVVATFKTFTPEWQAALANGTIASWLSAVWAPPLIAQNAPDTAGLLGSGAHPAVGGRRAGVGCRRRIGHRRDHLHEASGRGSRVRHLAEQSRGCAQRLHREREHLAGQPRRSGAAGSRRRGTGRAEGRVELLRARRRDRRGDRACDLRPGCRGRLQRLQRRLQRGDHHGRIVHRCARRGPGSRRG